MLCVFHSGGEMQALYAMTSSLSALLRRWENWISSAFTPGGFRIDQSRRQVMLTRYFCRIITPQSHVRLSFLVCQQGNRTISMLGQVVIVDWSTAVEA
jgi:hypothetical protein